MNTTQEQRLKSPRMNTQIRQNIQSLENAQLYDLLENTWRHISTSENDEIRTIIDVVMMRMHGSTINTLYFIDLIKEIAESDRRIPEADIALMHCYLDQNGIELNPEQALYYLKRAFEAGSIRARLIYANFLAGNETLKSVLHADPKKAIDIYLQTYQLENNESNSKYRRWAQESAVQILINGTCSGELPFDQEDIIRDYCESGQYIRPEYFYKLARFYSDGIASKDYKGPEYERARDLLLRGTKSGQITPIAECEAILQQWELIPRPPTGTQKAVEGVKTTIKLGAVIAILFFWSAVGLVRLSIANAINLYVGLPILIIIGAFWGIGVLRNK